MCQTVCGANGLKIWGIVSALVAIAAFSIGIFIPKFINHKLDSGLDSAVIVDAQAQTDASSSYQAWSDPSSSDSAIIYFNVYMFNLKNPAAVLAGTPPDVEEKGPYVYRKYTYKRSVVYSQDIYGRDIVSFKRQTYYEFDQSQSGTLTEGDLITNANLAFVLTRGGNTGLLYAQYPNDGARLFQVMNVSQWLWGYTDPVLSTIHSFYPCCTIAAFPGLVGPNQPVADPTQQADVIFVGTAPHEYLLRQYVQYEGEVSLKTPTFTPPTTFTDPDTWGSVEANRVWGTDGTQFTRNLEEGQTIQAYVSQLTRTVTLENKDSTHISFKGIDLLKFTLPQVFLLSSYNNSFNAAFYMNGFDGVANLTAAGTLDFFVSKPHFLDADPALIAPQMITGLSPNADIHDTYINVEPNSGATMQAAKRLQLSVRLRTISGTFSPAVNVTYPFSYGPGLPNQGTTLFSGQYLPVYWAEEYGEVPDSTASTFTSSVYGAQHASMGVTVAGEVIGCVFTVVTIVLFWVSSVKAGGEATK